MCGLIIIYGLTTISFESRFHFDLLCYFYHNLPKRLRKSIKFLYPCKCKI